MRQGSCLMEYSRDQPQPVLSNLSSQSDEFCIDPQKYKRRSRKLLIFSLSIIFSFLLAIIIIYLVQHLDDDDDDNNNDQQQVGLNNQQPKKKYKKITSNPDYQCRLLEKQKQNLTFSQHKILIADFQGLYEMGDLQQTAALNLANAGFQYQVVEDEEDFIKETAELYDIIWIISSHKFDDNDDLQQYIRTTDYLFESKKNLFIFADNSPHTIHANIILERHFDGMKLQGNYRGQGSLQASQQVKIDVVFDKENVTSNNKNQNNHNKIKNKSKKYSKIKAGEFNKNHALACDVSEIYEGNTVCSPNILHEDFKVFAYNYNNQPIILYAEANERHGRIIVDCGFSKMYKDYWDQQENDQYIINSNYWLAGIPKQN